MSSDTNSRVPSWHATVRNPSDSGDCERTNSATMSGEAKPASGDERSRSPSNPTHSAPDEAPENRDTEQAGQGSISGPREGAAQEIPLPLSAMRVRLIRQQSFTKRTSWEKEIEPARLQICFSEAGAGEAAKVQHEEITRAEEIVSSALNPERFGSNGGKEVFHIGGEARGIDEKRPTRRDTARTGGKEPDSADSDEEAPSFEVSAFKWRRPPPDDEEDEPSKVRKSRSPGRHSPRRSPKRSPRRSPRRSRPPQLGAVVTDEEGAGWTPTDGVHRCHSDEHVAITVPMSDCSTQGRSSPDGSDFRDTRCYGGHLDSQLNKLVELCTIVDNSDDGGDEHAQEEEAQEDMSGTDAGLKGKFRGMLRRAESMTVRPFSRSDEVPHGGEGSEDRPRASRSKRSQLFSRLFSNVSASSDAAQGSPRPGVQFSSSVKSTASSTREKSTTEWQKRRRGKKKKKDSESDSEEEEDWEEKPLRQAVKWIVFAKVGLMLMLAVSEIAVGLVLQVFWHECDFMCRPGSGHHNMFATVGLALMLACHVVVFGSITQNRDYNGTTMKWRVLYPNGANSRLTALFNVTYLLVLLISLVLIFVHFSECPHRDCADTSLRIIVKAHLVIHLARILCTVRNVVFQWATVRRRLQHIVSVNKRRFVDMDLLLDLDLTYIADRLVALALPCVDNAVYRNDIRQVARFFASRHYGGFVVTNLCEAFEENGNGNYDCSLLYNQVQKLPMRDHNAPALCTLVLFCESATEWLNSNKNNIVAVHCQGGKGRTGTFCSALMLWVGLFKNAAESAHYFAKRRTRPLMKGEELQGINAPCQYRYLRYLETMITQGVDIWERNPLVLTRITIHGRPHHHRETTRLAVVVETSEGLLYDHCKAAGPIVWSHDQNQTSWEVVTGPLLLQGDVTIRIFRLDEGPCESGYAGEIVLAGRSVKYGSVQGKCISFVTFNTAFHSEGVRFSKEEVDDAYKDKTHYLFPEHYGLELSLFRGDFAATMDHIGSQLWGARPASTAMEGKGRKMATLLLQTTRALLDVRRKSSHLYASPAHDKDDGSERVASAGVTEPGPGSPSRWKTLNLAKIRQLGSRQTISESTSPVATAAPARTATEPAHVSPAGSGQFSDDEHSLTRSVSAESAASGTQRRTRTSGSLWKRLTLDRFRTSSRPGGDEEGSQSSSPEPSPIRSLMPPTEFSRRRRKKKQLFLDDGTSDAAKDDAGVSSRPSSAVLPRAPLSSALSVEHLGLPSALRELALSELFDGLMEEMCGQGRMYSRGDVILDSQQPVEGVLFYVVSGQVSCEPIDDRRALANSALGMLRDPQMEVVGRRQLFGVGEALLGEQGKSLRTRYRAKSDHVLIRTLRLGVGLWKAPLEPFVDRSVVRAQTHRMRRTLSSGSASDSSARPPEELSNAQRCVAYEYLARDMTVMCARFSARLGAMTETAKVKHDTKKSALAEKKRMVSNVLARHNLPVIEMLLSSCEVTLQGPRRHEGHLLLFNHWLIFTPFNASASGSKDLVFRVESIASTTCLYETLGVELKPSHHASSPCAQSEELTLVENPQSRSKDAMQVLAARALQRRTNSESESESPEPRVPGRRRGSETSLSSMSERRKQGARFMRSMLRRRSAEDLLPSTSTPRSRVQQRLATTFSRRTSDTSVRSASGTGGVAGLVTRAVRRLPAVEGGEDDERSFYFRFAESGQCSQMHGAVRTQLEFVKEERSFQLQNTDDLSVLRHYRYLTREESLSHAELARLKSLLSPANKRRYTPGEIVLAEGEDSRKLIHILEGSLSVVVGDSILAMRHKGDLVGERSFMGRGNRGTSARLVTPRSQY